MLIYSGAFHDISGYGTAARDYATGLKDRGADFRTILVKYDCRGSNEKYIPEADLSVIRESNISPNELQRTQEFDMLWHSSPNASQLNKRAKRNILMTVWETDHVPESFGPHLAPFDYLITASQFSKSSFLQTFPDLDVRTVPHVLWDYRNKPMDVSDELFTSIENVTKDKFVFLWNAEWHIGKGYDQLLTGFCEAFKDNDDVVLLLKTYNLSAVNYRGEVIQYIKNFKKQNGYTKPKILPLIGDLPYNDVIGLYAASDAYISTSRREGFSLTASEAIGFGLPVIASDKGGHCEFLNDKNSIKVNSTWSEVQELERVRSLYTGQKWIELDMDDFILKLKMAYSNKSKYNGKPFQDEITKTLRAFDLRHVSELLIKELGL